MTPSLDYTASATATTAIVLAGGKNSRKGRPKALRPFGGEPPRPIGLAV
jgi:molybdopterin-guanine dinucleotide biosynthesis protein A